MDGNCAFEGKDATCTTVIMVAETSSGTELVTDYEQYMTNIPVVAGAELLTAETGGASDGKAKETGTSGGKPTETGAEGDKPSETGDADGAGVMGRVVSPVLAGALAVVVGGVMLL